MLDGGIALCCPLGGHTSVCSVGADAVCEQTAAGVLEVLWLLHVLLPLLRLLHVIKCGFLFGMTLVSTQMLAQALC